MKVKKVKIGIRRLENGLKHFAEVAENIEKGKSVSEEQGVYFENLTTMRKVLTDRRLKILKAIKEMKPSSIYELAKTLKRDFKNVNEDLNILEELGLVSLHQNKTNRRRITPSVNYDKIQLEITV